MWLILHAIFKALYFEIIQTASYSTINWINCLNEFYTTTTTSRWCSPSLKLSATFRSLWIKKWNKNATINLSSVCSQLNLAIPTDPGLHNKVRMCYVTYNYVSVDQTTLQLNWLIQSLNCRLQTTQTDVAVKLFSYLMSLEVHFVVSLLSYTCRLAYRWIVIPTFDLYCSCNVLCWPSKSHFTQHGFWSLAIFNSLLCTN